MVKKWLNRKDKLLSCYPYATEDTTVKSGLKIGTLLQVKKNNRLSTPRTVYVHLRVGCWKLGTTSTENNFKI